MPLDMTKSTNRNQLASSVSTPSWVYYHAERNRIDQLNSSLEENYTYFTFVDTRCTREVHNPLVARLAVVFALYVIRIVVAPLELNKIIIEWKRSLVRLRFTTRISKTK